MHILVILNPVSGMKSPGQLGEKIQKACSKQGFSCNIVETTPDNLPLNEWFSEIYDRVIVAGGDGTVNAVASYLLKHNRSEALAIIPTGSANLLAQSVGLPVLNKDAAMKKALTGKPQHIDAMLINNTRYGFIAAGQGYDVQLMKQTSRITKRRFGFFAYVYTFLKTFFSYRVQRYKITLDGKQTKIFPAKYVLVGNKLPSAAIPLFQDNTNSDGVLDVIIGRPKSIWDVLWTILKTILRRPATKKDRYEFFQCTEVQVQAIKKSGASIQIDGDVFDDDKLDVKILPNALKIIC